MILTLSKMGAAYTALIAASGVALVIGIQHVRHEAPAATDRVAAMPPVEKPVAAARDQGPPALANGKAEANAVVGALSALSGPALPPKSSDGTPSFDVARIEPNGDTVIAGRAAPGATVELLRNGEVHDRAVANQSGEFTMVPPPLPAGNYDLTLRAKQPDGKETTSKQNVAVVLDNPKERPVVALMTPDKPTKVLSQPAASKPGVVSVEAVETEPGGKLHVSGRARAAAAVRLYLNDSFIASATADAEGRFAVTINKGVVAGNYRVRLDEVDGTSGSVRARAEVPFSVPDTLITGSVTAPAVKRQDTAAAPQPQLAAIDGAGASDTAQPAAGSASAVVVPKIGTSTVSRGDSLWRLSRLSYGNGTRYAVIYKANQAQIRNPNLIYPGQIFVIPTQ